MKQRYSAVEVQITNGLVCSRCGAIVQNTESAKHAHDNFHEVIDGIEERS